MPRTTRAAAVTVMLMIALPATTTSCDWLTCALAELKISSATAAVAGTTVSASFQIVAGTEDEQLSRVVARASAGGEDLTLQVGQSIDLTGTERNSGKETAGQNAIGYVLASVTSSSQNQLLDSALIASLVPGDSATKTRRIQAIQQGVAIFRVVADYFKRVKECKEGNNSTSVDGITGASPASSPSSAYLIVRVVDSRSANEKEARPTTVDLTQLAQFKAIR